MRSLERFILLQIIDERWREHLHDMDYLREGIGLRGFTQEDPLVAYKNEAYTMFGALIQSIWEEFARYIFNVEVEIEGGNGDGAPVDAWSPRAGSSSTGNLQYGAAHADSSHQVMIDCAAEHFEFAEQYRYTYPGSVGSPQKITLMWFGELPHPPGGTNDGPLRTEETLGPGSSGTHNAGGSTPWPDTATAGLHGTGIVRFILSWQPAPGGAPSQLFYFTCT